MSKITPFLILTLYPNRFPVLLPVPPPPVLAAFETAACLNKGTEVLYCYIFNSKGNETDPKFISEGSYSNPHIENTNVEWYWPITPDGSDITTHNTEPNFNLQASSSAIDSGTNLTQAIGSGTNTVTLIVGDARYFQLCWGNGVGGGASVPADWIAIGTVSNTVQISSIDYATNTITLASPKTWSDKAPVWLYKKSDGAIVLYGKAPDCGAHEFGTATINT